MAERSPSEERLLRQLVATLRCSVCRRTYEGRHMRVAAVHDNVFVISVRCVRCRNRQIFRIALRDDTAAELTRKEEERFAALQPISTDDVLDAYLALKDFTGDVRKLFEGTARPDPNVDSGNS